MKLKVSDIVPYPELGQHWVFLNPLKMFRIDKLNFNEPFTNMQEGAPGTVFSIEGKSWTPHGVHNETWVLPLNPEHVRLLWFVSLMKIEHFGGFTPNSGSVWAFNSGELFFVGDRATHQSDSVWVFTDYELRVHEEAEMLWLEMREIQSGPEPLKPAPPEDPTALEQLLEDD